MLLSSWETIVAAPPRGGFYSQTICLTFPRLGAKVRFLCIPLPDFSPPHFYLRFQPFCYFTITLFFVLLPPSFPGEEAASWSPMSGFPFPLPCEEAASWSPISGFPLLEIESPKFYLGLWLSWLNSAWWKRWRICTIIRYSERYILLLYAFWNPGMMARSPAVILNHEVALRIVAMQSRVTG